MGQAVACPVYDSSYSAKTNAGCEDSSSGCPVASVLCPGTAVAGRLDLLTNRTAMIARNDTPKPEWRAYMIVLALSH